MTEKKGMTVQSFYDYITQHLTPEQALMRLLQSSLLSYEKLKFDEGEAVHPLIIISLAAMDMDWHMAVEKDVEEVRGIVCGTPEYMDTIFPKKEPTEDEIESQRVDRFFEKH